MLAKNLFSELCKFTSIFLFLIFVQFPMASEDPFLDVSIAAISKHTLVLTYDIDECCYIYKKSLSYEPEDLSIEIQQAHFPVAIKHEDEFFGVVDIYRGRVEVVLDILLPSKRSVMHPVSLSLGYQGCSDAGICFLPETLVVKYNYLADLGE